MKTTKEYISAITKIFPQINSITEIQCGNAYEIENCEALSSKDLRYIGVDLRDEIILDNRQYFRSETQKIFITLDSSNEPIPKSDLIIALNMAPFLPIANIWSLLENIERSEAKYFIFDHYHGEENLNSDLEIEENSAPKSRPINLTKAPFYFPNPLFLLPLNEKNHFAAFYKIEEISYFMDWQNEDLAKLRKDFFSKLKIEFATIKTAFAKEKNGDELFKEMMLGFIEKDAATHNQKYYYDQPYRKIIDERQVLGNRNNIFRLVYKTEFEQLILDYNFVNKENFLWSQSLTKDFIRYYFKQSLWID